MTAPSRSHGRFVDEIASFCAKKNRYTDIFTAIAIGVRQKEIGGIQLYTYRCPACRGWHLTKSKHGRNGNPVIKCSLKSF